MKSMRWLFMAVLLAGLAAGMWEVAAAGQFRAQGPGGERNREDIWSYMLDESHPGAKSVQEGCATCHAGARATPAAVSDRKEDLPSFSPGDHRGWAFTVAAGLAFVGGFAVTGLILAEKRRRKKEAGTWS